MLTRAQHLSETPGPGVSNDERLLNLIRLALADGSVTQYEIRSIRRAARSLGHNEKAMRKLIDRVRQSATVA